MDWKPPKLVGLLVGLLVVLTLVSTSLLLIQSMLNQEVGMSLYYTVLLLMLNLVVLGSKLYRCHDLLTLRYHLDRDALSIVCATGRHVVPLDAISRLAPAHELSLREFDGGGWPGYSWGRMPLGAQGVLQVHATQPPRQQLVAVTDQGCYVISPHDPEEFLRTWPSGEIWESFAGQSSAGNAPAWHRGPSGATVGSGSWSSSLSGSM